MKWRLIVRICVRGILIEEGKLLVIHRIKNDLEYYVIPGGGVEDNETMIQALKREILEEVGINIKVLSDNPIYTYQDSESIHSFYLISYAGGVYDSGLGPEFFSKEYESHGEYKIGFVSLQDIALGRINLVPISIKDELVRDLKKFHDISFLSSESFRGDMLE